MVLLLTFLKLLIILLCSPLGEVHRPALIPLGLLQAHRKQKSFVRKLDKCVEKSVVVRSDRNNNGKEIAFVAMSLIVAVFADLTRKTYFFTTTVVFQISWTSSQRPTIHKQTDKWKGLIALSKRNPRPPWHLLYRLALIQISAIICIKMRSSHIYSVSSIRACTIKTATLFTLNCDSKEYSCLQ